MGNKILEYIMNNTIKILTQVKDHLFISILALMLAAIVGILFGYYASKSSQREKWISSFFHILRVIPSLAILILCIPILGTGRNPAIVALSLLAIPPILINTTVGFQKVPEFLVECAEGMGMTKKDILWKVRVPQALPMILSGLRTSFVEAIASATLAAKIGAGGLGEIIFTGLGLNRVDLLLLGGILVAVLSLSGAFFFDLLSKFSMPYKYLSR